MTCRNPDQPRKTWRVAGLVSVDCGSIGISDLSDFEPQVIVPSGLGDGTYEVIVIEADFGKPWGKRVTEVRIVFIESDDDSEPVPAEQEDSE